MTKEKGSIVNISRHRVVVKGLSAPKINNAVRIGSCRALGVIKEIDRDEAVIYMLDRPDGIALGDIVESLDHPFLVELGPGLLGGVFNGLQKPLSTDAADPSPLDRSKRYPFSSNNSMKFGDSVDHGDICGAVLENGALIHRIMIPEVSGSLVELRSGRFNMTDRIGKVKLSDGTIASLGLSQKWDPTVARPVSSRSKKADGASAARIFCGKPSSIGDGECLGVFGNDGKEIKNWLTDELIPEGKYDVAVILSFEGVSEIGRMRRELCSVISSGITLSDRCVFLAEDMLCHSHRAELCTKSACTIAEYYRDMGYRVLLVVLGADRPLSNWDDNCNWMGEILERSGRVICRGAAKRQGSLSVLTVCESDEGAFSECIMRYSDKLCYFE